MDERVHLYTDPMHPEVEGPMFPNPGGDFTMDVQLQWLLGRWEQALIYQHPCRPEGSRHGKNRESS